MAVKILTISFEPAVVKDPGKFLVGLRDYFFVNVTIGIIGLKCVSSAPINYYRRLTDLH
jgi:hypothetical protein